MKVKKVIALFTVCLMVFMSAACSTSSGGTEATKSEKTEEDVRIEAVETVIGEFEYSCQTGDVDAMLECLNPGFAQALYSGRMLLNWMSTNKKTDEAIMNTMVASLMQISDITADLTTMKIEISDIELQEGLAIVPAVVNMKCSTGEYTEELTFHMSLESDGKWYIGGVTT